MPLKKNIIDIPLGGGVDEKTHPNLVEAPQARKLVNYEFDKTGSLSKRAGFTSFAAPNSTPVTRHFVEASKQLFAVTAEKTEAYDPESASWIELNEGVVPCEVDNWSLFHGVAAVFSADAANCNGYRCTVWDTREQSDEVWVTITAQNENEVIVPPTNIEDDPNLTLSLGNAPKVVGFQDVFIILALDTSGDINYLIYDTTTLSFGSSGTLLSNAVAYDVHVASEVETSFHMIVTLAASTSLYEVDDSASILNSVTGLTGASQLSPDGRTVFHNPATSTIYYGVVDEVAGPTWNTSVFTIDDAYVGPATAGAVVMSHGASDAAVTGSAQHAVSICLRGASNALWIVGGVYDPVGLNDETGLVQWADLTSAGALTGTAGIRYNLALTTKAFQPTNHSPMVGVRICNNFPYGAEQKLSPNVGSALVYPTGLVVSRGTTEVGAPELRVVARYHQDKIDFAGGFNNAITSYIPAISSVNEYYTFPGIVRVFGYRASTDQILGIEQIGLTFDPLRLFMGEVGPGAIIASGQVGYVDGVSSAELCPHTAPVSFGIAQSGTSSGPGFVSFAFAYVVFDREGNLYYSPVSLKVPAYDLTNGEDFDISLALRPPTAFSDYSSKNLQYAYFVSGGSTEAEAEAGPFVGPQVFPEGTPDAPPKQHRFTYSITISSVPEPVGPLMYTEGGVFPNISPPGFIDAAIGGGRVWGIPGEKRDEIWFSKKLKVNSAPEFSAELTIPILESGFEGVAIETMDDKVVVFSESRIIYVGGEGPNDAGQLGSFVGPVLVSADAGCINRNSVVSGPFGIVFQSEKGIYLLNRGLQLTYIGAPVEDSLGGRSILSADLVPEKNQVRFVLNTSETVVLVYDYFVEEWCTFEYTNLQDTRSTFTYDNTYGVIGSTQVSLENSSVYTDRGAAYYTELVTNWFKLKNIAGYQRVWRATVVGDYYTGDFQVQVRYDYDDGTSTTHEWTDAEIAAFPDGTTPFEVSIHIPRQKTESLCFRIRERPSTPANLGRGISLNRLTLEAGLKEGTKPLPDGNNR